MDIEQHHELIEYLQATGRIRSTERPRIRTLAGGVSNRTVRVDRESGEAWVLKQALPKLRVAVDWFSDPSRIEREALAMKWLVTLAPEGTTTPLIFEDKDHHLVAMRAVGEPHENWKQMLLAGHIEDNHVERFAAMLGAIHRHSAESHEPLAEIFEDRSFFESLRIEPYYEYSAAQVPDASEFLHALIADTRGLRLALVHGDFSPKNILVCENRLVLIDHEVIHWGDPAFDVGFALTHLLSKAHHLRDLRFIQAAQLFCDVYAGVLGPGYWSEHRQAMAVRHTLACLLARVAGRSLLEYLDASERQRQRSMVVPLMTRPPQRLNELLALFTLQWERNNRQT